MLWKMPKIVETAENYGSNDKILLPLCPWGKLSGWSDSNHSAPHAGYNFITQVGGLGGRKKY